MRPFAQISLILALAFAFAFPAYPQTSRTNYQLLWKISGNGLAKPSYLFGTMHLKDKRVFDFSDSVLVKLDGCPAFAMEILPDTIIRALFTQLNASDTTDNLSKTLTPEEYQALTKRLKEEAGVSIDKVKNKEPWVINMLLDKSVVVPRKGDKTTFLDAYLFRLARHGDKKLIGLEMLREQTPLLNDFAALKKEISTIRTELSKAGQTQALEEMIKIYWSGDMNQIQAYVNRSGMDQSQRDQLLIRRNVTMVDRLAGYIREQPTFTAVGAAHLPGKEGMLELLRAKGFTVTPVKATFTGMAARYREKEAPEKWYTYTSQENAFAVDMPAEPFPYDLNAAKNAAVKLYMLPDLATGMVYYHSTMPVPNGVPPSQQDAFFKKLIESMVQKKENKLLSEKKITFDTYPGREVEIYDGKDAKFVRGRFYLRKNNVYMLMASGAKEQLYIKDAERYFNSLRFQDFAKPDWKEFSHPAGGFRIKTPVALTLQTKEADIPDQPGVKMYQNLFTGSDQHQSAAYIAMYSDFSPGFVIVDDSTYLSNLPALAQSRLQGEFIEKRDVLLQNFPGKAFALQAENVHLYCRAYLRGSRVYYLIVTTTDANEAARSDAEAFLNSFVFTDLSAPAFRPYASSGGDFTVQMPGQVNVESDSAVNAISPIISTTYASNDAQSGQSYFAVRSQYSDYYQATDEKNYFRQIIDANTSDTDSLLRETVLTVDGMPAREIVLHTKGNHTVKRSRLVLRGRTLYEVMTYLPLENLDSPHANVFFESFHFSNKSAAGNLFTPKTDKLLADLTSADALVKKAAGRAVRSFSFAKQDLPALYRAIKRTYPGDTTRYGSTRQLLIDALSGVNDSTTLPFLAKLYPTFGRQESAEQLACLQVLAGINSEASLALFTDLIMAKTPEAEYEQSLFYAFSDPLAPSKVMFPRILPLLTEPHYGASLAWLVNTLLEKGVLRASDLATHQPAIVADAQKQLAALPPPSVIEAGEYHANHLVLLARVLGNLSPVPESTALLTRMMDSGRDEMVLAAGLALLKNNQSVNKKALGQVAANAELRLQLYDELASVKKLDLFPTKYLTQAHFAESRLVDYLVNVEESGKPARLDLLEIREETLDGKRGRLFVYKFQYDESEEGEKAPWYVGISGLQPLDKKQVSTNRNDHTNTLWKRVEEKKLAEHIKELLPGNESQ